MTIGEKILNLRKARGWSQEELADRVGVTRQAVSRWESDSAKPDADRIIALCDLFGVSADYLLRDGTMERVSPVQGTWVQNTPLPKKQVAGWICMGFGCVVIFILCLLSSFDPCVVWVDGVRHTWLYAYIYFYNLGWLVILAVIGIIAGIILLFGKRIMQSQADFIEDFKKMINW